MKYILAASAFLLFGCAHAPTATETLTESTKEAIKAIEESLPKECQTESVKLQFSALESKVDSTLKVCENEKALLEEEKSHKDTWLGIWFTLCVVLAGLLVKTFLRK